MSSFQLSVTPSSETPGEEDIAKHAIRRLGLYTRVRPSNSTEPTHQTLRGGDLTTPEATGFVCALSLQVCIMHQKLKIARQHMKSEKQKKKKKKGKKQKKATHEASILSVDNFTDELRFALHDLLLTIKATNITTRPAGCPQLAFNDNPSPGHAFVFMSEGTTFLVEVMRFPWSTPRSLDLVFRASFSTWPEPPAHVYRPSMQDNSVKLHQIIRIPFGNMRLLETKLDGLFQLPISEHSEVYKADAGHKRKARRRANGDGKLNRDHLRGTVVRQKQVAPRKRRVTMIRRPPARTRTVVLAPGEEPQKRTVREEIPLVEAPLRKKKKKDRAHAVARRRQLVQDAPLHLPTPSGEVAPSEVILRQLPPTPQKHTDSSLGIGKPKAMATWHKSGRSSRTSWKPPLFGSEDLMAVQFDPSSSAETMTPFADQSLEFPSQLPDFGLGYSQDDVFGLLSLYDPEKMDSGGDNFMANSAGDNLTPDSDDNVSILDISTPKRLRRLSRIQIESPPLGI